MQDDWITLILFHQLHVLKFPHIIIVLNIIIHVQMYHGYLQSNVHVCLQGYSLRICHDLKRQCVCSTMRAMSLSVKGVQTWHSLCDDLKIVNICPAFKRKCKKQYLY